MAIHRGKAATGLAVRGLRRAVGSGVIEITTPIRVRRFTAGITLPSLFSIYAARGPLFRVSSRVSGAGASPISIGRSREVLPKRGQLFSRKATIGPTMRPFIRIAKDKIWGL